MIITLGLPLRFAKLLCSRARIEKLTRISCQTYAFSEQWLSMVHLHDLLMPFCPDLLDEMPTLVYMANDELSWQ